MSALTWDEPENRKYEHGVDHGVLYLLDESGEYSEGVAWNGLTTVTESPSGAESNKQYADNMVYLNLVSAEEFAATIEALTYPDEFGRCDGTAEPEPGVTIGQQNRESFGFSYRTKVGNSQNADFGYKLHLVYGALAAPSEKAHTTINDSPEATPFSWEVSTTPVGVGTIGGVEYKPTSTLDIDSTRVDADALANLESILYGDESEDPRLPLPSEVYDLFEGTTTEVRLTGANAPAYNSATHVVTLPSVTGVTWTINGVEATAGAQPALGVGETAVVEAHAAPSYTIDGDDDWTYDY